MLDDLRPQRITLEGWSQQFALIDNETIRYHIRPLVEEGKLNASKSGRYTVYHSDT